MNQTIISDRNLRGAHNAADADGEPVGIISDRNLRGAHNVSMHIAISPFIISDRNLRGAHNWSRSWSGSGSIISDRNLRGAHNQLQYDAHGKLVNVALGSTPKSLMERSHQVKDVELYQEMRKMDIDHESAVKLTNTGVLLNALTDREGKHYASTAEGYQQALKDHRGKFEAIGAGDLALKDVERVVGLFGKGKMVSPTLKEIGDMGVGEATKSAGTKVRDAVQNIGSKGQAGNEAYGIPKTPPATPAS